MRNLVAAVLGGLAVVVVGPVVGASPASACSCVAQSPLQHLEGADVVVVGTVVDRDDSFPVIGGGSVTYTVEAETVYKGQVAEQFEFSTAAQGSACGLEGIEVDRRVLLLLGRGSGGLHGSLCGGTGMVSEAQVRRILGPMEARPTAGGSGGGSPMLPYAGAGVLAAVAVGGAAWLVRRARRG